MCPDEYDTKKGNEAYAVELDGQTGLASAEAAAQSLGYVSANDNDSNNVDNPLLTNAGYAPLVAGAFDGTEASFAAVYTEARRKVGDELEFPTFAGKRIDISDWHKLYVEVLKLGGHQAVTNGKLWAKVFSKLKLPLELTSASNGLRKHYVTFLASFEEEEASRLVVASGSVPSASGAPCTGHELDGPEARMDVLAATAAAAAAADTAPDTVAAHEAFEEDEDVTIAADAKDDDHDETDRGGPSAGDVPSGGALRAGTNGHSASAEATPAAPARSSGAAGGQKASASTPPSGGGIPRGVMPGPSPASISISMHPGIQPTVGQAARSPSDAAAETVGAPTVTPVSGASLPPPPRTLQPPRLSAARASGAPASSTSSASGGFPALGGVHDASGVPAALTSTPVSEKVKELQRKADEEKQEVETQKAEEWKRISFLSTTRLDEIDRKTTKAITLATLEAVMNEAEDNRVRVDAAAAAAHDTKQRASGVTKEALNKTKKRKRDVADKRKDEDKARSLLLKRRLAEDKEIKETRLAQLTVHEQAIEEKRVALEAKDKSDAATKQDVDEKKAKWIDAQGM